MRVAGTTSSHTVCQMPVVRGYQIECGVRLPILLAAGLGQILRDHRTARTTMACSVVNEQGRDVGRERRVSAFVLAPPVAR